MKALIHVHPVILVMENHLMENHLNKLTQKKVNIKINHLAAMMDALSGEAS